MIGMIEFPMPGNPNFPATLEDDGSWTCEDASVQRRLNSAFSPRDSSPADGAYGFRLLRMAAESLGGTVVEKTTPPAGKPGTIY